MPDSDRIETPALGVQLLAGHRDLGNADAIGLQAHADLINEVARRAANAACDMTAKKNGADRGAWIRWVVGLVIVVITALWGVSLLFAARPTEDKVHDMIMSSKTQHPDSKAGIEASREALYRQQIQLNRIEDGVKTVGEALTDLKSEVSRRK